MLRRTKNTVSIDVPPREELTVFIPMTEAQRFWTYRLLTRLDTAELQDVFSVKHDDNEGEGSQEGADAKVKDTKTGEQNRWKKLMNLLMQLRKVCNHMLDLLEDFMELRGTLYARLDGSTARPRRTLEIKLFQQEKSPYQVFLISTKAGGLGINLTKASTVIMFDSDWNPQNDLQAIARAHRIGQTKTVKVYRLICQGSVEDQMLDRLRRKLFLSLKIMGSDNSNPDKETAAMKTNEVMDILRKGSSALSRTDNGLKLSDFVNAPIGHILQLSRERDGARAAKLNKELGNGSKEEDEERLLMDAEEEEKKLLTGVAQVQSRLFEGKVVQRTRGNKDIANEWQELQKRARQNRFIVVDGYEVLAELLGPEAATNPARAQVKKAGRKFESEDWCIYCRDGGELVICGTCPRGKRSPREPTATLLTRFS
ncbi:hypothetical protein EW026_g3115 [Hermanssonia centrifuga]|uniref:Helicase C-terminal domain-containing protein n=1 Tax=Hermanssonia centrifuga TaxID=98765 RepID=A0A4S4KN43_9APHY|nr:hypothetical protein EW026_g3115 [Hermanssonia centrifuga]